MKEYDVIILGGGPGGYISAIRCRHLGLSTALVEKEALGGMCLNWGCIPTKSLLRNAEVAGLLKQGENYGFSIPEGMNPPSYSSAQNRSRQVSDRLVRGLSTLMKKNGVQVIYDEGYLRDINLIELKISGQVLKGKNIILATGAEASYLPGLEPDGETILSPRNALSITDVPKTIAIIGAGAIGMEFASIWNAYGSEIHIFELLDSVLPKEDGDVSAKITEQLEKRGIRIHTSTTVREIQRTASGLAIRYQEGVDKTAVLETESALMALGIVPNSTGNGIDKLLPCDEKGFVRVNEYMETEIPGVYGIGDLTGLFPLAHVASAQGIVAAEYIAGLKPNPVDYQKIPKCTYCRPEVASIGYTEDEVKLNGLDMASGVFPFYANGKALSLGENNGFVKMISEKRTGEILGVHMVGPHVTEMIGGIALAMKMECTVDELAGTIFPHPSVSEAIMEAAHGLLGHSIHI